MTYRPCKKAQTRAIRPVVDGLESRELLSTTRFGVNELGNLAALGRDAHGRNAVQFDRFLLSNIQQHGLTPPIINPRTPIDRVAQEQTFIINRFALAASFNTPTQAGGVLFSSTGIPVQTVSRVNIFTYFPVFRQFPDQTGLKP